MNLGRGSQFVTLTFLQKISTALLFDVQYERHLTVGNLRRNLNAADTVDFAEELVRFLPRPSRQQVLGPMNIHQRESSWYLGRFDGRESYGIKN